jgi:hypothetical protein
MDTILRIAQGNCYPSSIINQVTKQIMNTKHILTQDTAQTKHADRWITFEYHSPLVRKLTNIFKNTNLRFAYRVTNSL